MSQIGLAAKASLRTVNFDLESYLRTRTAAVDRALDGYLKRYAERSGTIWKAMHYGLFPRRQTHSADFGAGRRRAFCGAAQCADTVCLRGRNDSWLFAHP